MLPESSNFSIVQAGPKDADLLIQLIHEFSRVHNNHDGPEINAKILTHDLENHVCIAYSDEEPAGMALYYLSYSTWQGQRYTRLSLNVLDWNENATKLYALLGAVNLTKDECWLVYLMKNASETLLKILEGQTNKQKIASQSYL